MSLGLWIVVDAFMYGAGAAQKLGYMKGNDGATPLCHVGTFSGACSECHRSLLIYLCTRRGMPLTERLERHGGLFLDSASMFFFVGGRLGSGELPEDILSSVAASLSLSRRGSLPLFCLTGVAGWLCPRAFLP